MRRLRTLVALTVAVPVLLLAQTPDDAAHGDEAAQEPQSEQPQAHNERAPSLARPPWTDRDYNNPNRPSPEDWWRERLRDRALGGVFPPPGIVFPGPGYPPPVYYGYGHAYGPHAAPYGYIHPFGSISEAYQAGRADERDYQRYNFNINDMNRRQERLLSARDKALSAGLAQMRAGAYAQAVTALSMAAELDQGDPAARIHLAQVRLALGQHEEAGKLVQRALELQPKLTFMDLKLARYYAAPEEFDRYADRLAQQVAAAPAPYPSLLLHGYIEYQRGNFAAAHLASQRLIRVTPRSDLVKALLQLTLPPADTVGAESAQAPRTAPLRP